MKKVLVVLLCLGLTGCATWPCGIEKNRKNLMKLEIDMSKQQVIDIMGEPYNREVYKIGDSETLEFLIYLTKYTDSGTIPDSDTTPICFKNGKLIGWGRNFYIQEKQRYELEIKNR
jgi:hypothetical protein